MKFLSQQYGEIMLTISRNTDRNVFQLHQSLPAFLKRCNTHKCDNSRNRDLFEEYKQIELAWMSRQLMEPLFTKHPYFHSRIGLTSTHFRFDVCVFNFPKYLFCFVDLENRHKYRKVDLTEFEVTIIISK